MGSISRPPASTSVGRRPSQSVWGAELPRPVAKARRWRAKAERPRCGSLFFLYLSSIIPLLYLYCSSTFHLFYVANAQPAELVYEGPQPSGFERAQETPALARAFTPMSTRERRRLSDSIESARKLAMRQFFRVHEDV